MLQSEINILQGLENIRNVFLNSLFEYVTMLGEHTVLVVIIAVMYFMIDKNLAKRLFYITMISLNINGIVKNFVKAPRPFATGKVTCVRPGTATGYSFPSGHTQNFSTWSTALAYRSKKLGAAVLSALGILAVAFSRMYLGAHYPRDVIAGAILGIALSLVFSIVYDKIKDKHVLYLASVVAMIPFAIAFLIKADVHFKDFYKFFGMLTGLLCASVFEEKYVNLDCNISFIKKLIRVILGITVALLLKEGLGMIDFSSVRISLVWDAVRYFILIFAVMGLYTLGLKKAKM